MGAFADRAFAGRLDLSVMVAEWPALNSRAWLRLRCCGAEHPTRIEGFTETGCIVATPSLPHANDVDPKVAEGGFFLGWVNVHHALEAPVELTAAEEGHLPTWTIASTGDAQETQRRAYVRMGMKLEVQMKILEGAAAFPATAIDVSEGGLKCVVDARVPDPRERTFDVSFVLDGQEYSITAQTAWWGGPNDKNLRSIGLRFLHDNQSVADSIRSFIFAQQLEARRRQNA